MSRDIQYIGMDVHKEAIVIAVLNGSGKLVMESIVETKASSILQFIHGLRGELHVTWEEGTWAAWLYDLLKPHVHQVLVCDPRRNALLKEGNKSDKIDARKLADLLRTGMLRPVYHGEHGLRTLREPGAQLSNHPSGSEPSDEPDQGSVSRLEHSLCGYPVLCSTLPRGMVTQD
jgi:transposase